MSRSIDADRLKAHYAWWRETENGRKMADLFDEIVDAQPTADVVEVVRCENCKWQQKRLLDNGRYWYECGKGNEALGDDGGFCSDGDQKEAETT